jgi:Spy/CpxP family protein refolding chaperone
MASNSRFDMRRTGRTIPVLVAAAAMLAFSSDAFAQAVAGPTPIPTLENLQTGLREMIRHLSLTHAQREQVERIFENETVRLAFARGNPDLSVAKYFTQVHDIRLQARRQIESILTPRQRETIAKRMIHEMEEQERWGEDGTGFFSIPANY